MEDSFRDSIVCESDQQVEERERRRAHHLEDAVRARTVLVEVRLARVPVLGSTPEQSCHLRFARDDFLAQGVDEEAFLRAASAGKPGVSEGGRTFSS